MNFSRRSGLVELVYGMAFAAFATPVLAAEGNSLLPVIPVEFCLFGLTLVGIALFHRRTLEIALAGLAAVLLFKPLFAGFREGPGPMGLASHLGHEWVQLSNLLGSLTGFALLADQFYESRIPAELPRFLPDACQRPPGNRPWVWVSCPAYSTISR